MVAGFLLGFCAGWAVSARRRRTQAERRTLELYEQIITGLGP